MYCRLGGLKQDITYTRRPKNSLQALQLPLLPLGVQRLTLDPVQVTFGVPEAQ
jgi:hypothetical protein